MPHFTVVLPEASTSKLTIPSGSTRIISPMSFAVITTVSPGSVTSASKVWYMPLRKSYPVTRTLLPACTSRPSSEGMELLALAAREAAFIADWSRCFSQVNFISFLLDGRSAFTASIERIIFSK